jgi:hypothetical protein
MWVIVKDQLGMSILLDRRAYFVSKSSSKVMLVLLAERAPVDHDGTLAKFASNGIRKNGLSGSWKSAQGNNLPVQQV